MGFVIILDIVNKNGYNFIFLNMVLEKMLFYDNNEFQI